MDAVLADGVRTITGPELLPAAFDRRTLICFAPPSNQATQMCPCTPTQSEAHRSLFALVATTIGDFVPSRHTSTRLSTSLVFEAIGKRRVRGLVRHLPQLAPRATHVLRFAVALDFGGKAPPTGPLEVEATADSSKVVTEANDDNNTMFAKDLVPVIAR